jgi:hypothetical protein
LLTDARAAPGRDHADAADPGPLTAAAEVGKSDRGTGLNRDKRVREHQVERVDHVVECPFVDLERHEVIPVRGREDRREVAP